MQIGPYEVLGELGRGGMGIVYRARHLELGHEVALKLLSPSLGSSAGTGGAPPTRSGDTGTPVNELRWIERFRREAQAAGRLGTQPGIVGVLDVGEDDGRLYLAMQLIEGHALDEEVRGRVLEVPEAFAIVGKVARAVAYAHAQGIIHRDLKPGNILVDHDRGVWVTDFGLAARTVLDDESQRITRTNDVVGTPAYLAPEQLLGETVDARTDVHALGCTLYELLTGATPFESKWLPVTCRRVLQDEPAPPSKQRPELGADADAVVLRCLEKDPAERYPTAAALAADCERIARGEAPLTRPPSRFRRASRWLSRRRVPLVVVAVVLVAGAAGFGAIVWSGRAKQAADAERGRTGREAAVFDVRQARAVEFGRLAQRTQADFRILQDRFHEAPVTDAEVEGALQRLHEAARAVDADHPSAAGAAAWSALGDFYAGRAAGSLEPLEGLVSGDGADPFPAMVLALARVEDYVRALEPPRHNNRAFGMELGTLVQASGDDDRRLLAEQALRAMPPVRPDDFNAELAALYELLAGARLITERKFEAAEPALGPSTDDPFLGALATHLLGFAALARADYDSAERYWAALQQSRGWRDAARGRIRSLTLAATAAREDGEAADALLVSAEALADQLFTVEPSLLDRRVRGRVRAERALWLVTKAGDSPAALEAAIADLEITHAAGFVPDSIMAANLLALRGLEDRSAGLDPMPWLQRAAGVLAEVKPATPIQELALLQQRLFVQVEIAAASDVRGVDPAKAFDPPLRVANDLLAAMPETALPLFRLAQVYLRWADAEERWNRNPSAPRAQAIAALRRALALDGTDTAYVRSALGGQLGPLGRAEAAAGRPFEAIFTEAEAHLRALTDEPGLRQGARSDRALLYYYWAEARWNSGGDALGLLKQARDLIAEVLVVSPGEPTYRMRAAEIELFVVRARHAQQQPALKQIERARDLIQGTAALPTLDSDAIGLSAGRLFRLWGDDCVLRKTNPMPYWEKALDAYGIVITHRPRWGEAMLQRATCRLSMARYAQFTLRRPGLELLDAAIADLDRYLGLRPDDAAVWANRGSAHASKGTALKRLGQDPKPSWNRALHDLARAGELSPTMWQVHANRGLIFEGMGRDAEALAAYEAALRSNPRAPRIAELAADARKRLGR